MNFIIATTKTFRLLHAFFPLITDNWQIKKEQIQKFTTTYQSQCNRIPSASSKFRLPWIIAHRGGGQNWPENTLYTFHHAADAGVDAIELDIQLSKDGELMVYHPRNLSERIEGEGFLSTKTKQELQTLHLETCTTRPGRLPPPPSDLRIPTLTEVLAELPDIPLIIDLKSTPAQPLIEAIARDIPAQDFSRLIFYSTEIGHLKLLQQYLPQAVAFEDRDRTFFRLTEIQPSSWRLSSEFYLGAPLDISERTSLGTRTHTIDALTSVCNYPSEAAWIGFELKRTVTVEEAICPSSGRQELEMTFWNSKSVACVRNMAPGAAIVFFGINTIEDYWTAAELGADAVYTDQPLNLIQQRVLANP